MKNYFAVWSIYTAWGSAVLICLSVALEYLSLWKSRPSMVTWRPLKSASKAIGEAPGSWWSLLERMLSITSRTSGSASHVQKREQIWIPPATRGKLPRRYRFGADEVPVKDWKVFAVLVLLVLIWGGGVIWAAHKWWPH